MDEGRKGEGIREQWFKGEGGARGSVGSQGGEEAGRGRVLDNPGVGKNFSHGEDNHPPPFVFRGLFGIKSPAEKLRAFGKIIIKEKKYESFTSSESKIRI